MVTDDVILEHLIKIGNEVTATNAKLSSLTAAMEGHIDDDKEVFKEVKDRVTTLEDESNRSKGEKRVYKWIIGVLGSGGVFDIIYHWFSK